MRTIVILNIIVFSAVFIVSKAGFDQAEETIGTLRDSLAHTPGVITHDTIREIVAAPPPIRTPEGPTTQALKDLTDQNTELRALLNRAKQDIDGLRRQTRDLSAENTRLKNELAQATQRYQNLLKEIGGLRRDSTTLQLLQSQIADYKQTITKLQAEIARLKRQPVRQ